METLLKDSRYGLRMLLKSPGFTFVALLSLALGIGANTAIFSMVSAFLFAPLPVERASQLVSIFTMDAKNPGPLPTSHLNFIDYRDKNDAFSDILGYTFAQVSLSGTGGESKQLFAQVVSGNYFDVLGVKAEQGRMFSADEDKTPGTNPVVVLSYGAWQREFGGDASIVGRTISLNRHDFAVVGIAAKDFTGTDIGGGPALWVPMMMHDQLQPGFDWYNTRRGLFINMIGRLKPGVGVAQAQAAMTSLGSQLEQEYRKDNEGRNVRLMPLLTARKDPTGDGQVMLTSERADGNRGSHTVDRLRERNQSSACARDKTEKRNRDSTRDGSEPRPADQTVDDRELIAFDWRRSDRVSCRHLVEGCPALAGSLPASARINKTPALDPRVLIFAVVISIVSGLLFGLAPALQASKTDLVPTLKGEITMPRPRVVSDSISDTRW